MARKKKVETPEVEVADTSASEKGNSTRINKTEIVNRVAAVTDFHKDDVRTIIGGFTSVVEEALVEGEEPLISEFGSFYLARWKARRGRNPATGEPINIGDRVTPKFKFSKKIIDRVSEANAPLEEAIEEETQPEEAEPKPKRARKGSGKK